jgi:hypothetical protein
MPIIQASDFTGELLIPQNSFTNLSFVIQGTQKHYLLRLLGAELYGLFIADLNGNPEVPQDPIYEALFDPFEIDDNGTLVISQGIKEMLKQFTYFHHMRDAAVQKTGSGVVKSKGENSQNLGYSGWNLVEVYNQGITNAKSIQWYIQEHSSDYPKYNGICLEYMSGI